MGTFNLNIRGEVRVAYPCFNEMAAGDTIRFNGGYEYRVARVARYPDFQALVRAEDPRRVYATEPQPARRGAADLPPGEGGARRPDDPPGTCRPSDREGGFTWSEPPRHSRAGQLPMLLSDLPRVQGAGPIDPTGMPPSH
jgi:hypothetical protein